MPCMHPGIGDQTDKRRGRVELLITEQSDQEDEDYDDGDRFDNINEANSQDSAQKKILQICGIF